MVLVRNSYPWWTNECTNSIFHLSPFPKLSLFLSPLNTLSFFLFFLEFEFILFFIRRQLVFLCCQIISHLFLITFVCTWFLFTHQSLYGISFYLFPESMEWGLYRERKKKKGRRKGGRVAFIDVDVNHSICLQYAVCILGKIFNIFFMHGIWMKVKDTWKCSILSNHIAVPQCNALNL